MALRILLDEAALRRPSFEVIYAVARSYLPAALRALRVPPHEVDDVVHDIVLAAHEGLNLRGRELVPLGDPPDPLRTLKAWLSGIAWRKVSHRRHRGHGRYELSCEEIADLPPSSGDEAPSSEQLAADAQRRLVVAGVLQRLRSNRADVLVMFVLLDMTAPEIAAELGINENTVKSRLLRARGDFLAGVKRLPPDERGLLAGSAFLLPFGFESWWPPGEEQPWTSSSRAVPGLGLVAGAMAALVVWSGAALEARASRTSAPSPQIVAVRDLAPVDAAAPPSASASPAVVGAPGVSAPSSAATAAREPAKATVEDTMARESYYIGAARGALGEGAFGRALTALDAHEQQFPRGALASQREWLRRQARSALREGSRRGSRR